MVGSGTGTRPRVAVFGLGGTIAMTATDGGPVAPALSAEQIVAAVPGIRGTGVDLSVATLASKPGSSLTIEDVLGLAAAAARAVRDGAAGVVVTQGTDTIEETAYLLDLLHDGPAPVVVTGAMRNPTMAGADGPANLLGAVTVAASPAARDLGALVVFADEIHAARRVRKAHTTSISAFVSADGPLGHLVEGTPRIVNRLPARYVLPPPAAGARPRVVLLAATLGDDGTALSALAGQLDGLVVAGFGAGHVPQWWLPQLTDLAARIPVVLATRTGAGPVLAGTYGFPGSERDLLNRDLVPAGTLDPLKARILLHLALAAGADRAAVRAAFAAAGGDRPDAWPWPPAPAPPGSAQDAGVAE